MKKAFLNFLTAIFCLLFLVVPMVPDVQVYRYKLMVLEIVGYLLFITFLIYVILENKIFYRDSQFLKFLLLFLFYIFVRFILSKDKFIALNEFKRWLISGWLFFAISLIDKQKHKLLINFFIFGSFISIFYGFLQHYGDIKIDRWIIQVPKLDRVMSMFGNPIFFAVHIINVLPIVFGMFLVSKKIKFIYFLLFLISLPTLYYTKTRAAFLGLLVSSIFFVYEISKSKRKFIYLISLFLLFLFFGYFTKDIWLRQQAHILIWRDSLNMWLSKPVFGFGLGRFHIDFVNFASERLRSIWPERNFIINDAHNEYIQLLVENGIVGFCLFIIMMFTFFKETLKYIKKLEELKASETKIVLTSLLSGCVAVLVQNFFSVDLRFIISNIYLFLTIGFITGSVSEIKEKSLIFKSSIAKVFGIVLILFLSGVLSFSIKDKTISFLSLAHFSSNGLKFKIDDAGHGLLQYVIRPYLAVYKLQKEKDFFDEKIFDTAKTLEELKEIRKKFPNKSIIYERIAWIYAKEKKFDKAIENYVKAINLNPNSFGAYNNLGNIMFLLNNMDEAIKLYKKSIELNPKQVDARVNLGIAYYFKGKIDLAAEQFNEVLKIAPNNEKAITYIKKMRE
jgi:putative inorganic carbon (HCO3(-)) transporter